MMSEVNDPTHDVTTPAEEKVWEYADELDFNDEETVEEAAGFAFRTEMEHPVNRSPRIIAASSLYLAGLWHTDKITQREICELENLDTDQVSEVYRLIADHEGLSSDDEAEDDEAAAPSLLGRLLSALR